ncbi:MAG: beta-ketoacyl-[acyl-carrier-protein] synthase family protein [Bacteroidales bacterium]|jgi:3-oxoacyl-[acyl-carrier-protein] synthase-1|nr:beta-ketoacyl-[acyl-carrier-protein] synthase family protein [Bacteroidales bacterium]
MSIPIYVTGLGIITGIGNGKSENLQSIIDYKSAVNKIEILKSKHSEFPVSEIHLTNNEMCEFLGLNPEEVHTRTCLMGRIALREALQDANISSETKEKIAFISGTTVGGMDQSEQFYFDFLENDLKNNYIKAHDCGTTTEMIAKEFAGDFEIMTTISTACSSALNSIILGANLIKTGKVDIAIVGGSESLSKFHFNGFNTLMILDKEQCRPFDKNRAGLNLGEGAAYVVLESKEAIKRRKIKPLCQLLGYANTCDAFHQTATSPEGIGATLAMRKALENSNLQPEDIDYINAHGTGTENNDLTEGTAIMKVFGENIPNISSIKSFIGHTTSAAGSIETVISILAMINNFIPANLNFSTKIDEFNFIPNDKNIKKNYNIFITNSFGFGGNDSSCVFSKIIEK